MEALLVIQILMYRWKMRSFAVLMFEEFDEVAS